MQRLEAFFPNVKEPVLALVKRRDSRTVDDVYSEIYVLNTTKEMYSIKTSTRFFQTVDEESGAAAVTGPSEKAFTLAPQSYAKVGDIIGWELTSRWVSPYRTRNRKKRNSEEKGGI